jgi:S1-C subfamily serine protease
MFRILILSLTTLIALPLCAQEKLSVVRVNVTNQAWDFLRPWGKKQPQTRRAIGAVLEGGRVIVTGDLVANAAYVEFETPEGGKKVPAAVEFVDYEANLALLKTSDDEFMRDVSKLAITESDIGDELSVWQLESNGRLLRTKGLMTTAEMMPYPVDGLFLIYRMTVQLQGRDSSFTLPVVRDGKLTGVLMAYDNTSSNANIIPAPVIEHFLKDAKDGKYDGFPRAGYGISAMRDPALRRYAKVPADVTGGVFINAVQKDGPAERAGLKKGDVLVAVNDLAVDQDGNFPHPKYGKIPTGHIFSTMFFVGDTVNLHILREGEKQTLEITLTRKAPEEYVIDPYIIDKAPRFYILGGFVLQEISRQMLKEFGAEWTRRAPSRAVYMDRHQSELFENGPKKIVYLTRVLPTPATVGYEEVSTVRVIKINDVELQSLNDVPAALEKPINGFHKLEFDDSPKTIYLDAKQVAEVERMVQMQYRLPTLKRLE